MQRIQKDVKVAGTPEKETKGERPVAIGFCGAKCIRRITYDQVEGKLPKKRYPRQLLPFLGAAHDLFHGFSRGFPMVQNGIYLRGDGEFDLVFVCQCQ